MGNNFKVSVKKQFDDIHLNLYGELDGSSALVLIEKMQQLNGDSKKIYIHTGALDRVYEFGRYVLSNKFKEVFGGDEREFLFTGHLKDQLLF